MERDDSSQSLFYVPQKITLRLVLESDGLSLVTRNGAIRLSRTAGPWL